MGRARRLFCRRPVEPFTPLAKPANTPCVPSPKDEEGHPRLGLRGLWSSFIHNLRIRANSGSRRFSPALCSRSGGPFRQ